MKGLALIVLCGLLLLGTAAVPTRAPAQASASVDDAALFGAMEAAQSVTLSADGSRLAVVAPGKGGGTIAVVIDPTNATPPAVIGDFNGKPANLRYCDWSAADRLVCVLSGIVTQDALKLSFIRFWAVSADGSNPLPLGKTDSGNAVRMRQYDGQIVDWLDGVSGGVLMARNNIPEVGTNRSARNVEGLGVERIDTRTGKASAVERPDESITRYISDGLGTVRIKTVTEKSSDGMLRGIDRHYYRKAGEREWLLLGTNREEEDTLIPLAVDPTVNAAYVLQRLNGRLALYRIALDGSLKNELVFGSPEVDVDDVVRVGRGGRVIGASYVTDRRQAEYFDPVYREIAKSLASALPKLPLLYFVSASADERVLLVRASSDVDPGHYYVIDRDKKKFTDILQARSPLRGKTLSQVKAITYVAADGTKIPGYLTLPPGVTEAKNLPAIVMPHGGPAARDEWGFDWLAQFWAQRGYAVLQPNFRGSAGYGDAWFADNGFKSWKIAIGDVCDGGRWLVAQGIADPSRLAIFGWSYGGYAALQASVLDANLFKAVIAVAPVTDLAQLKNEARDFTNSTLVSNFIGSGPHIEEGSPARHAAQFKAPVLMFHGDMDINVDILQSRRMDKALRAAGKSSELIVYPNLDHGLRDGTVRADMLRRSDAFLRQHLQLQGP